MATRTAAQRPGAHEWVPEGSGVRELASAAKSCRGCELFEPASQVVFGKGNPHARVVLIGEQPGDKEDREGLPFVGPAGRLLDRVLADAGLDPAISYVTNAVKHFRFEQRGQRRLHKTPEPAHVRACRPWLEAELADLRPEIIIALGAVAGRALLGPSFRVTQERGVLIPWPERAAEGLVGPDASPAQLLATLHPSAILRADDRDAAYAGLVADLKVAAEALD